MINWPFPFEGHLNNLQKKYNTSTEMIALAWVMAIPGKPCAVLGSTNSGRVEEAAKVLSVPLSREEWFFLLQVARGREIS